MTRTLCCTCGVDLGGPEMSAPTLAHFLAHIQGTQSIRTLHGLAHEIEHAFPNDDATPRLTGIIEARAARLVGAN